MTKAASSGPDKGCSDLRYLNARQYRKLIDGAKLLRADRYGPKVYQTSDGRIIKLFRVKRWWSSSVLYPYSWRFLRNSRRLRARGIRCVDVEEIFYCRAIRRHGVIYRRLDGAPLDSILPTEGDKADAVFRDYAMFIARLHGARIYFRSLHPGNVLRLSDGSFGLIDIADMRFSRRKLTLRRRIRNFGHLLRSAEFQCALRHHAIEDFVDAYLSAVRLSPRASTKLRTGLLVDLGHRKHPVSL